MNNIETLLFIIAIELFFIAMVSDRHVLWNRKERTTMTNQSKPDRQNGDGLLRSRDWVNCPICDEPDMKCDIFDEGATLIHCTNHGCPSNKRTVPPSRDTAEGAEEPTQWTKLRFIRVAFSEFKEHELREIVQVISANLTALPQPAPSLDTNSVADSPGEKPGTHGASKEAGGHSRGDLTPVSTLSLQPPAPDAMREALADQIEKEGVEVYGVWHPRETIKKLIVDALRSAPVPPADGAALLPCDVHLPPATYIRRGCTVATLMAGLRHRENFPNDMRIFSLPSGAGAAENSAPAAVRGSDSSTPRSPASAAMGHCAGVEAGAAEPAAVWTVRRPVKPADQDYSADCYWEVLLPDGVWDQCVATGADDARKTMQDAWAEKEPAVFPPPVRGDREAMCEACDLLAERKYGNPARSPGHNARLCLESALRIPAQPGAAVGVRGEAKITDTELAEWGRNWHWNDCIETKDKPVDLSIYFRDMRMLKAFVTKYSALTSSEPTIQSGAGEGQ